MSSSQPQSPAPAALSVLQAEFTNIVGAENVLTDEADRRSFAHDRLPFANFCERLDKLAGVLPRLVLRPGSADEVQAIVTTARRLGVQLIPFGNGSGVLGGAIPVSAEVTVDLRRLDRIVSVDPANAMVTVQAGMNGGVFEAELNAQGYTTGHLPQSIEISTVGGWAACRGGGQASSRYGKIEDMVVGLKAVLPDGTAINIRPVARRATGPSIRDILVGSEGTLGIITEVTMRLWKLPEVERGVVLAFPSEAAALDAARDIMQAELRPLVARIYDAQESSERTENMAEFQARPILAIYVFAGREPMVTTEQQMAMEICRQHDAVEAGQAPYDHWRKNRYVAFSAQWQKAGYFNDTIEITGNWSALPEMFETMGKAVREICPDVYFGAHWSHIYPEGACQYMTIRLPPMDHEKALPLHAQMWQAIEELTLEHEGSIAHHHGVGVFRNGWIERELGGALPMLQQIKDALDPGNLMNPGKLGLRLPEGAVVVGQLNPATPGQES
ncbi:FAD-binding oxidoreductase [Hoeflea sp. YIM 152468]|uniref:FAD-binding oxidoreductase n=1 Tax=Hoeflea sp. YIM 152468 TaxID=3031759 RepID=UPI0023DB6266|nr:FAD-binding oxidoreductase [Hoeflea sp. YIM 152468]MDF1609412.1 FAD-binding oxidoreductase [Hoeflea sp. YIM 152468]